MTPEQLVFVAGVPATALALAVGIWSWRASLVALLVYIPVSGIPILAAYGEDRTVRAAALLGKDVLFVLPAYVGFALWAYRRRERISFTGAPLVLVCVLAALVVGQAFNPSLPNLLVGLIGIKVWLLYVPLLFLGYHLVRSREELFRVLGLMSLVAVPPAVVGIVEAGLIYGGHADVVYGVYGDAAYASTQRFTELQLPGGGTLKRVPSTFSYVIQYYSFLAVALAVSYAWWRGWLRGWQRLAGIGVSVVLLFGLFFTGQRGAFVFVPLLLLLVLGLEAARGSLQLRTVLPAAAGFVAALLLVLVAIGTTAGGLVEHLYETSRIQFDDLVVSGFREAIELTVMGLGAGADTNASRYAYENETLFQGVGGRWYEGWYVKTYLELGVLGLVLVALLFGTILVRAVRAHLAVSSTSLGAVTAVLVAVVAWTLIYNFKGQYLDFDPLNVYFWLFAGLAFKVPALETVTEAGAERAGARRPRRLAVATET